MIEIVVSHPELSGWRWMLATRDSMAFIENRVSELIQPERWMDKPT